MHHSSGLMLRKLVSLVGEWDGGCNEFMVRLPISIFLAQRFLFFLRAPRVEVFVVVLRMLVS